MHMTGANIRTCRRVQHKARFPGGIFMSGAELLQQMHETRLQDAVHGSRVSEAAVTTHDSTPADSGMRTRSAAAAEEAEQGNDDDDWEDTDDESDEEDGDWEDVDESDDQSSSDEGDWEDEDEYSEDEDEDKYDEDEAMMDNPALHDLMTLLFGGPPEREQLPRLQTARATAHETEREKRRRQATVVFDEGRYYALKRHVLEFHPYADVMGQPERFLILSRNSDQIVRWACGDRPDSGALALSRCVIEAAENNLQIVEALQGNTGLMREGYLQMQGGNRPFEIMQDGHNSAVWLSFREAVPEGYARRSSHWAVCAGRNGKLRLPRTLHAANIRRQGRGFQTKVESWQYASMVRLRWGGGGWLRMCLRCPPYGNRSHEHHLSAV
jgi:hypothetical protein